MDLNFILLIRAVQEAEERDRHRILKRTIRDTSNPFSVPEGIFRGLYRLRRDTAIYLVEQIQPFLPERIRQEISLSDAHIVLCALHFYSQGSYQKSVGQDLNFPMCQSSVSNCIEVVTTILNDYFSHLVRFPMTQAERADEKRKFMAVPNGFPRIIGAIDCTHIKIHPPKIEHDDRPAILFLNRKGVYTISTQLIVGADMKILAVNARYPGSVHDSAIWSTSQIRNFLRQNYDDGDNSSWLIGDSGYPLEPWLMKPVSGRNLNDHERNFNIAHRSVRNVIERLNGVLKATFRCCFAERTLHYAPEKASKIINACAILYIRIERADYEEEDHVLNDPNDNPRANINNPQQRLLQQEGVRIRQRIMDNYF